MDAALRAISKPIRRQILRLVWDREMAAGEIAEHFDVTRPAVSQHLTVLRSAGLLAERREGTRRIYRARRGAVEDLQAFVASFWGARLERLRQEAELDERRNAHREPRRQRRRP